VNIVLIGYRCTGKSSVGRILSARLRMPLYDTDDMIGNQSGKTVSEIVRTGGWESFRRMEKEIVRGLEKVDRSVIVPGGGAVMDEECRISLSRKGIFFWLTAEPSIILSRMCADGRSAGQRPPLSGGGAQDERAQMDLRRPVYLSLADFRIDTTSRTVEETAERIREILEKNSIRQG